MGANLLHSYNCTIAESGSGGGTGIVGPNEWNNSHQLYLDVNAQTGTSYALLASDDGALVTFNNASAVAVTIAAAQSGAATIGSALGFYKGWFCTVKNLGAGLVTITPTTSTIDGASTLTLKQNQSAVIYSDGTNYQVERTGLPNVAMVGGGIATPSGATVTIAVPGGGLNKFYNAGCDIDQRGTAASALTVTTSGAYVIDGTIVLPTGASVTAQQAASQSGMVSGNALKVAGAASVTDAVVRKRIESLDAGKFAGQTVTVQCKVYNNTGGSITPQLSIGHPTTVDTYSSPGSASLSNEVSAQNLQAAASAATTTLAWTFSCSANAINGIEVNFDFGNNFSSTGKSIYVSDFDIRVTPGVASGLNGNPPPPEFRVAAQELALCQRYFLQITAPGTNSTFCTAVAITSTRVDALWQFPAQMRVAPTINFQAASNYRFVMGGSFGVGSAIVTNSTTPLFADLDMTVSGATAGQAGLFQIGTSGSNIQATAEL